MDARSEAPRVSHLVPLPIIERILRVRALRRASMSSSTRSTASLSLVWRRLYRPPGGAPDSRGGRSGGELLGDGLEAGPVVLGLDVVVHDDHQIGSALPLRHDRGGIVHGRDR